MFFIKNTPEDEHLVQVNIDILTIPKLIYKTFYCRLIYIGPDRILKAIKDVGINRIKALEYYCELYTLSKSIYIIFHILLALIVCCFIKIYVDIIKYKLLSTN